MATPTIAALLDVAHDLVARPSFFDTQTVLRLLANLPLDVAARMTRARRLNAQPKDPEHWYAIQLCAEFETVRQAAEKVQDDEALSKNVATRLAEIVERLKLVGIDPDTLQPPERWRAARVALLNTAEEATMATTEDLEITALNAMAASPDGAMTLSDLTAHLETRLGSSNEASKSAQSPESESFRDDVRRLLSIEQGSGGLLDRGLATVDDTGHMVRITAAGHQFIGH